MRKKLLAAVSALCVLCASSCSADQTGKSGVIEYSTDHKLSIVCTTFPGYDWTKQILKDREENVSLTYLLDDGTDMHNFQPSAQDIMTLSGCDILIYVGGESDEWVDKAISDANNKDMTVINLLNLTGENTKEEEIKEGMQAEEEEEEDEDEEDGEEETEYDEHVWLSLRNAKIYCEEISRVLSLKDPDGADSYKANLEGYEKELDSLDAEFRELFSSSDSKTLIFADRFPFRYFTEDYGLDYYAAFVGCSAETEASFETILFLTNKVDELGCGTIFTIENSDSSIAKTVIENTKSKDQNIAVLNSMQSVNSQMIADGASYVSFMKDNYNVLSQALK